MSNLLSLPCVASASESLKFYKDLHEKIQLVSLQYTDLFQNWKVTLDKGVILAFYAPSAEKYMIEALLEFKKNSVIEATPIKIVSGLTICGRKTVRLNDDTWQEELLDAGYNAELIDNITEQVAMHLEETSKLALLRD